MYIITPMGRLLEVKQAVPVVEKYVRFNGSVRRMAEVIKDSAVKPNAIALENANVGCLMPAGRNLFIGNLTTDKVRGILSSLLKDGYYDFSSLEYQKPQRVEELVWDNGKGLPFNNEESPFIFNFNFFDPFYSPVFQSDIYEKADMEFGDEEEGGGYDEE